MIICSCNVLSDHAIRTVVRASKEPSLSPRQVYDCLGCSVRCGRCARAVRRIITEAVTACPLGCGCCPRTGVRLEHDAEKWVPVFGPTSCSSNNLKRDVDSKE